MVFGIVMAAGLSTRMGTEKLLLPVEGKSMLASTLERVAQVCDRFVVVTKPVLFGTTSMPDGAVELVNEHPEAGQASSIALAMRWILENAPECRSALFFPADMPLFDIDAARSVAARAEQAPEKLIVAQHAGSVCNPCAFGAHFFEELAQLEGDLGGRQVIRRHPEAIETLEFDHVIGEDIDTLRDYFALLGKSRCLVVVRGAGDIATGSIYRLHRAGFPVVALDIAQPTVIRRTVAFAQAIFDGQTQVNGVCAERCETLSEVAAAISRDAVPVLVDAAGEWIKQLQPDVVVDAILAKINMGTTKDMAPVVVAVGPGFCAGSDCHAVVETKRGHTLGTVIESGSAIANTGVPGVIGGVAKERVIHSPATGTIRNVREIGDHVEAGEPIAHIGNVGVPASISGMLRGLINDGMEVQEGLKIADIDPRDEQSYCFSISDKALSVGGGVLEAVLHLIRKRNIRY